jgi:hypothetical protein
MKNEIKSKENNKCILFISIFIILILGISIFNYIVDPYYIFRNSTIKGFNNVKIHKYTNKRTIIYSDIKLNSRKKTKVFTGNCLLSHYESDLTGVVFFTLPVAKVSEVTELIRNIISQNPQINTIYWGMFFDDFCNDKSEEVTDTLPKITTKRINIQDFINLFFSYNTTKYSIQTVITSIKSGGKDIIYVYPYREIAKKEYNKFDRSKETLEKIENTIDYAKNRNVKINIYYSPIHITKKMHIYAKGYWNDYINLKREIVKITNFYDYSYMNKYNTTEIDKNNEYYIDNIHPSTEYNNLIVEDIMSKEKKIGKETTKENIEENIKQDTKELKKFIISNKRAYEEIKNLKDKDYYKRIDKHN